MFVFLLYTIGLHAQSYNSDRVASTNFLVRMYTHAPFEGMRVVNDYDNAYLISVLALDKAKYKTEAILNRVASVKAMAQASRYLNGSTISQDIIIHTTEKKDGTSDTVYVVKRKCTTANIVIYSVISFFYSQKFFCTFV